MASNIRFCLRRIDLNWKIKMKWWHGLKPCHHFLYTQDLKFRQETIPFSPEKQLKKRVPTEILPDKSR